MKITKNFRLEEFIDPVTYKQYGSSSIWFIEKKVILITQKLRDRLDVSLYVNTWHMGLKDPKIYSGYRPPGCTVGASKSQHRFGRADDVKTDPYGDADGADKIRDELKTHFKDIYQPMGLTTIESEKFAATWCHLDTRWTKKDYLFIVKP